MVIGSVKLFTLTFCTVNEDEEDALDFSNEMLIVLATTSPPFSDVAEMAGALRVMTLIWHVEPPQTSVLVGICTFILADAEVFLGSVIDTDCPLVDVVADSILPDPLEEAVNLTAWAFMKVLE